MLESTEYGRVAIYRFENNSGAVIPAPGRDTKVKNSDPSPRAELPLSTQDPILPQVSPLPWVLKYLWGKAL